MLSTSTIFSFIKRHFFQTIIITDVLVLSFHLMLGANNHFFHLDFEHNLPTFYQSFKLIVAGGAFLFFGAHNQSRAETKFFVFPLGVFLTFLGLDELLQLHENVYQLFEFFAWLHPSKIVEISMKLGYRSSLWILYYVPFIFIFVLWSGYWLHYFQSNIKKNFVAIAISTLCLFTVILMELTSSTGSFSDNAYFWLVTIEETAEMILATSLVIVGSNIVRQQSLK